MTGSDTSSKDGGPGSSPYFWRERRRSAATACGWWRDRTTTEAQARAPNAAMPRIDATPESAASPRSSAPSRTATIGSITVSPAITISGGPDAYDDCTNQEPTRPEAARATALDQGREARPAPSPTSTMWERSEERRVGKESRERSRG